MLSLFGDPTLKRIKTHAYNHAIDETEEIVLVLENSLRLFKPDSRDTTLEILLRSDFDRSTYFNLNYIIL